MLHLMSVTFQRIDGSQSRHVALFWIIDLEFKIWVPISEFLCLNLLFLSLLKFISCKYALVQLQMTKWTFSDIFWRQRWRSHDKLRRNISFSAAAKMKKLRALAALHTYFPVLERDRLDYNDGKCLAKVFTWYLRIVRALRKRSSKGEQCR